jgi:hypothetical protein
MPSPKEDIMPAQESEAAWDRGARTALMFGLGVILLAGLLLGAGLISSVFHRTFSQSIGLVVVSLACLAFFVSMGFSIYNRHAGGRVLMDCGPARMRVLNLISGVLLLTVGLLYGQVVCFLCGTMCLSLALPRFQIREGGIWVYWGLMRWDKMESCRWGDDSTLRVKMKTTHPFLQGDGRVTLTISPKWKQAVDDLLQKHCPVWGRDL